MVTKDSVLDYHKKARGKIESMPKVLIDSEEGLATFYTPGVSYVSEEIKNDISKAYDYTSKSNTVAIVSDGTRILGLGDIGPEAGLPVMEGKAALFKRFGGVDAVPICVNTKDEDEIVKLVKNISPVFGGINIEDIESPKSFRIARRLDEEIEIPVFHDDSQGTGVVALAALINALRLAGKDKNARIVVNGAGSAGFGITMQLLNSGYKNIVVLDSAGAIFKGREGMNFFKSELARLTNREGKSGSLQDLIRGADVFIGASVEGALKKGHISLMNRKPVVFALANPYPEISYEDAKSAGAYIVATGRSDKPNQVNNLLAFPGIMRGLLDVRSRRITYKMLHNAAVAISRSVGSKLEADYIIPSPFDRRFSLSTVPLIAATVAESAVAEGYAKHNITYAKERKKAKEIIARYLKMAARSRKFMVAALA
ncbi:NADP-dependent malic enzyme [Candidatus Marsarchaeota archaeon]|nr:NADP-dependent malic enzyme [Candidatus Marsarchaeota archaeon]